MKPYIFIALLVGLTACNNGDTVHQHDPIDKKISDSNRIVTHMATKVMVSQENRSDDREYVKYKLDNVNLSSLITPGETSNLKFTVSPDGEIIGIQFETDSNNIPDAWKNEMERQTGTNKFVSAQDENLGNAVVTYNSYAKHLNLHYADFGVAEFKFTEDGVEKTANAPFAGGYAVKKIEQQSMSNEQIVFNGTARGNVEYANGTEHAFLPVQDRNAQLTFDNGVETLSANFKNWHKMDIEKDGNTINVAFSAPTNPDDDIDTRFQMNGTNDTVRFMETGYYGSDNRPSEAVALFEYQEKIDPSQDARDNNRTVYVGFGGKDAGISE